MQIFEGEIRFGIHAGQQNRAYDEIVTLWKRAEELGLDWASCFDHFLPIQSNPEGPCYEGLTLLAALAAQTSRIRCGILVTGVTYRYPAVLANIATTIDHVSGGRLELGIGAAWYEMEHQEYGIPFPPPAQRIHMLGEAVKIVKSLWTDHRTTFEGRYYSVTEALSEPKPVQKPYIPLWIGGSGEKLTLRVVAESADGWNTFYGPIEEYRRLSDVLAGHCRDVGRNPSDIRKSLVMGVIVRETESEARDAVEEFTGRGSAEAEMIAQRSVFGTPEQCVEKLLPFVRLGVSDFLMSARAPLDTRSLELWAKEVAPIVKKEGKSLLALASLS